jgi:hypothetical protein
MNDVVNGKAAASPIEDFVQKLYKPIYLWAKGTFATKSETAANNVITPTLQGVPTLSTLTYTKDGSTINFEIGQFCRVANANSPTGYDFYQLQNIIITNEGESNETRTAAWQKVGEGTGVNDTETSVAGVPVDKSLCIVTIADGQTAQSFSLVSAPSAGRTIHVMVDNSGNTSDLTVTVPHGTTDGINYVNTNDLASGSMEVAAGMIGEINVVYASSKAWVRYIGA